MLPVTVSTDKITRAIAASPPLEAGNVYVPGHAAPDTPAGYQAPDWVASLIEEAATFPNGKHDDQVDAYSQAINWAQDQATTPARLYVPRGRIPDNLYALGLAHGSPSCAHGRLHATSDGTSWADSSTNTAAPR